MLHLIRKFKSAVLLSLCMFVTLMVFSPVGVYAAATDPQCDKLKGQFEEFTQSTDGGAPTVLTSNCYSPGGLVNRSVAIAFVLAGSVAVLFLIIGGLRYITSAGNEQRAEGGKKTIMWAAIGLAVIILAATLVTVISQFVVGG